MGKKSNKTTTKSKDCYQVLGVNANASQKTLKQAYLNLSKKYHPDKQADQQCKECLDKAKAKFQEIKKAYEEALARLDSDDMYYSEEEEDDYDYDQHMYKRGQQQSYFSFEVSQSKEINIKETPQEVAVAEDQISEDEEIERRAAEQVEEYFAYEEMGKEKMKKKHHFLVNEEQVEGLGVNLGTGLYEFRSLQKYEQDEHKLIAGCRSCNKWFEGIEPYLSHIRSDSHRKKSLLPRFSRMCNGILKVTYDTLSLRQRQDPSRWKELSQEVQHQIESTVSKVRGATACITEKEGEEKSTTVCQYVKNISSNIDTDLIIKCSAKAQFCNVEFNSAAEYYRHHSMNVEEEVSDSHDYTVLFDK